MAYGGRASDDSSLHGDPSRENAKLYELNAPSVVLSYFA
jgi:hypothetical protein